jgi:hypothetical protein
MMRGTAQNPTTDALSSNEALLPLHDADEGRLVALLGLEYLSPEALRPGSKCLPDVFSSLQSKPVVVH